MISSLLDDTPTASTMRIVITGAPSSGKSTLISALEKMGHHVVPEAAREILLTSTHKEGSFGLQQQIENLQEEREQISTHQITFFDRGLPDSLAYRRMLGFEEDDILSKIDPRRYDLVFLCRFGEHHSDGIRVDDVDRSLKIENSLRSTYQSLGCQIIELPWEAELEAEQAISRRIAIILEHISNL